MAGVRALHTAATGGSYFAYYLKWSANSGEGWTEYWDNANTQWRVTGTGTASDGNIALSEVFWGDYQVHTANLGSYTGWITERIHNDSDANDIVVAQRNIYLIEGEEKDDYATLSTIIGNIASLDAANTTDFDTVDAAIANLQSTIDSVDAKITTSGAFADSSSPTDGTLTFVRGASYSGTMNAKKTFTITSSTDITSGTATLTVKNLHKRTVFTSTATPTLVSGTTYRAAFTVTTSQTDLLPLGSAVGTYGVSVTLGSDVATPHNGTVNVVCDTTGETA